MSDEADPLYQPLGPLDDWAAAPVDHEAWAAAVDRFHDVRREDPEWAAMVDRGVLLAAAHQSAALDGLYPADPDLTRAFLRGEVSLASVDEDTRAHVHANVEALRVARDVEMAEDSFRHIHEVACRPQLTHPVRVDDRVQDHILAAGDYKHHPNHILHADGSWRPTAPVAQVADEMAALVACLDSPAFARLHPVVRAAYLLHALDHVQPFADGNGRVARALAGAGLLRAASVPFLDLGDDGAAIGTPAQRVGVVQRASVDLIEYLASAERDSPALDRWRAQEAAGDAVRRRLVAGLADALHRYGRRLDRRADLSAAAVVPGEPVAVRIALGGGRVVEESIRVDAHPEDGEGPVLVIAVEAGLRLKASPETPLDPWLDRVVPTLALRVAVEFE